MDFFIIKVALNKSGKTPEGKISFTKYVDNKVASGEICVKWAIIVI